MDDEIKDALRLAKNLSRNPSKRKQPRVEGEITTAPEPEQPARRSAPYNRFNDLQQMLKNPPQVEAPPPHYENDPKYKISPEEYESGKDLYYNKGSGNYVMSNGGSVDREGYALGGEPTSLQPGSNPATTTQTPNPYQSYVDSLYQNVMGRQADDAGRQFWGNQLSSGQQSTRDVLNQFAKSQEFQNLYGTNPTQAVSNLYQTALGRSPEQAGLNYWTQQAQGQNNQPRLSANELLSQFQTAPEYQLRDAVLNEYINTAGEAPTPQQYADASQAMAGGKTLNDVTSSIANTNLINNVYQGLTGRTPDPEGLNYWTSQLNNGTISPQAFMNAVAGSDEAGNYANTQYLNSAFQQNFGRPPSESEIKNPNSFYNDALSKMAEGTLDAKQLIGQIQEMPEAKNYAQGFTLPQFNQPATSDIKEVIGSVKPYKIPYVGYDIDKAPDKLPTTVGKNALKDVQRLISLVPTQADINNAFGRGDTSNFNFTNSLAFTRALQQVGIPQQAALAIAGNAAVESAAQRYGQQLFGVKEKGGQGVGSLQFTFGPRKAAFLDIAKDTGGKDSLSANVAAIANEMKNPEYAAMVKAAGNAPDLKTATAIIARYYENPNRKAMFESFPQRYAYANAIDNLYKVYSEEDPYTPPPPPPPPVLATEEGIDGITQSTGETITDGGVGGLGVGAPSTPSMTPISGIGGGIDFSAPSAPPPTYTPPPPHTGISAPISHPPVTHTGGISHSPVHTGTHDSSFGVGYASDPYFGHGGSSGYVTNFNPHQMILNRNTGLYHDPSSDISYDPNRAGSKTGGRITRGLKAAHRATGGAVKKKALDLTRRLLEE